jgi:hypothetical protein
MNSTLGVRVLEPDNNKRGDLFGRLMCDLFVALGYETPRCNIHKAGRELDLSADHRVERRRMVAECKATGSPIGGDDVNKFVGALDAERRSGPPVTGYFVSLSGFRETASEQERQGRRTPIVLLNGEEIIDEMVRGQAIISWARATELGGRCCAANAHLTLDPDGELLAHNRGWIWAVYYTDGKARTHFALIHSDGTPLARPVANEVIAADRECGGSLTDLDCLNPAPRNAGITDAAALAAYLHYLDDECGFIQLDGLPADHDLGSRRLRLENLFVPLHLAIKAETTTIERQPVGTALGTHPRLAILAPPGSGKSTLLKRLAIAYADVKCREWVFEDLPERQWFPLFFRCRELRALARGSFADLVRALSEREGIRPHAAAFLAHVDRVLLEGRAILLIDGLDEISDSGDRASFVSTVRSTIVAYPGTALVVTSREAGFRHVAAQLAPICTHATLTEFDEDDIRRLCRSWHRELVGDTEKVLTDSDQLAQAIVSNDRIKRIAVNPMMLTTLFLVKRWMGTLPTRRAVLYGKAIEVLLMTWNTEGHTPIPEEEALPQLCYVASAMMLSGEKRISRPQLAVRLREARNALPTELGYVEGSVEDFIRRVEDRSSLLMMTGHDVEDGQLVEFFEFRHLTFQEFLTARGIVEGWHPDRNKDDTLVSVLEPYIEKDSWVEVIRLAAVLGGRATESLLLRLMELLRSDGADFRGKHVRSKHLSRYILRALANCLADEVAASPDTIRQALRELIRRWITVEHEAVGDSIGRSKYGRFLLAEARDIFYSSAPDIENAGRALSLALYWKTNETVPSVKSAGFEAQIAEAETKFLNLLASSECRDRCEGALGLSGLAPALFPNSLPWFRASETRDAIQRLIEMQASTDIREMFSANAVICTINDYSLFHGRADPGFLEHILGLTFSHPDRAVRRCARNILLSQRLASRDDVMPLPSLTVDQLHGLVSTFERKDPAGQIALLVLAWYKRAPWSDAELAERARTLRLRVRPHDEVPDILVELCGQLGIAEPQSPTS